MKKSEQKNIDSSDNEVTHLLWTGGWDSTFRLLQLIFDENKKVQPHYIIRPQECTGKEIDTIHDILRVLCHEYPEKRDLILPMEFINSDNILVDNHITKEYKNISEKRYISQQYEIFARYCKQNNIGKMETGGLSGERIDGIVSNDTIFRYFEFPLIGISKVKMAKIAKESGWTELMKMTWFCRRPKKGNPCGFCGPCTDAVLAGLGWRLPFKARIIANIQLPFRKWWRNNYSRQNKGWLVYIPKLLKGRF